MVACCLKIENLDLSIVSLPNVNPTYSVSCFPLYLPLYPLVLGSSIVSCSQNTLPTPSSCPSRASFHPLPLAWNVLPETSICWNPLYPPVLNSNVSPSTDTPLIPLNSSPARSQLPPHSCFFLKQFSNNLDCSYFLQAYLILKLINLLNYS